MKGIIVLVALIIVGTIGFNIVRYAHTESITAKVTNKERITKQEGDKIESFYLVYTDKGALKLEDDLLRGNWNSSDVYGSIKPDSTYTFTVSGYRVGFFSWYPNIIAVN